MSDHFLTHNRLAALSRKTKRSIHLDAAEVVVPSEPEIDPDDYRTFVIERRASDRGAKDRVLVDWLIHRSSSEDKIR